MLKLDIKEEIEDEEKTIEDYIDTKMNDIDPICIESMYSVASQCLHEKKNKRPDIKKVPIFYVYLKVKKAGFIFFPYVYISDQHFNTVSFLFFLSLWKVQQLLQEMTAS